MPYNELTPASNIPTISLPNVGVTENVHSALHPLPYSLYTDNDEFIRACVEQVSFVYYQLGGGQLNVELDEYTVYQTYQQAVMDYSEMINTHQAANILSSALGGQIGKFDSHGNLVTEAGYVAPGTHYELKFPKFDFSFARHVADLVGSEVEAGGSRTWYKTYFDLEEGVQDYDLQTILETQAEDPESEFYGKLTSSTGRKKVNIMRVFYKSPRTMWRFYGFLTGGLNVLGYLSNYGMFNDDGVNEIVPAWQNRLQAMTFKDNMFVRTSHFSFKVVNNHLRLYPTPDGVYPSVMWVEFMLPNNIWEDEGSSSGLNGVNNINTVPFENMPFEFINSIGKNWIRKYSLALCRIILGNTRSKVQQLPFLGGAVQLNGAELVAQGKEELKELRENYLKILEKTTYEALAESESKMAKSAVETLSVIPLPIFIG
jgi:hypothetical protein